MDAETMIVGVNKQFVAYLKEKKNYSFEMNPYEMLKCAVVSLALVWIDTSFQQYSHLIYQTVFCIDPSVKF